VLGVVSDVVIAGLVPNTLAPVPVSSVNNAARLAEDGVAKNVAAPVARPETPVEIGKPVALVNVTDVGVPSIGVTSVGLVLNTKTPEPVSSGTAAIICAEVAVNVLFAKLIVLFVRVSVVALPTSVSVAAGNVSVPEATE